MDMRGKRGVGKHYRTSTLYIKGISQSVKDRYKALCARRGKTMTDTIEEHMVALIQEEEPNYRPPRKPNQIDYRISKRRAQLED